MTDGSRSSVAWPTAFVAASVAFGDDDDAALEALDPDARAIAEQALEIASEGKVRKARAIAVAVTAIAVDLDRMEVAWG